MGWDRSVILVIDYSVDLSIEYSSNRKKHRHLAECFKLPF